MYKKQRSINYIKKGSQFLLLITSLFIVSACRNILEPPMMEMPVEGKGYFSLMLDDQETARTIMPTTVINDFAAYKLEFYHAGTTINPVTTTDRTNSTLSNPVLLNAGTWDLYVSAYMDSAKTKLAAQGCLQGIEIGSGKIVTGSVELWPNMDSGEGTFKWDINYPTNVNLASVTITPLNPENGTPEQNRYFIGGTPTVAKADSLTLKTGFYRVVFKLANTAGLKAERRETLHVYRNMESAFAYIFEATQFTNAIIVTSDADSGLGSLRQAITDVPTDGTIVIDNTVKTILLTSRLPTVTKNITIEGNGVTITRAASWTTVDNNSQLLYVSSGAVTVRRVHFKDGRATTSGAAIANDRYLTLESCIFSGNKTNNGTSNSNGGALYNGGTMNVKSCTFYGNSTTYRGGAIFNNGTLTLTGNLFYGNTATNSGPVVYWSGGTITSNGYNVVDIALGTGTAQSGWTAGTGDKVTSSPQILPVSFKLLSGNQTANVITILPSGYPSEDFYGNPIINGAAAGAVQSTVSVSGYYLSFSANDTSRGSVSIDQIPSSESLYSGQVIITANSTEGYDLLYWVKNGINIGNINPLTLNLTDHIVIQAVFGKLFTVNNFSDASGSESVPGTLRHALTNAQNESLIILSGVTPGVTTIPLTSRLPDITKNITIEGNGVIITRDASVSGSFQLMNIDNSGTATIRRIHFKDSMNQDGGAIYSYSGNLTLESCIFSGNVATGYGGAVCNTNGTLNIKGCTFYGNSANAGGAIHKNSGNHSLAGNIFYGNTGYRPVVNGTATSNGYNVVDVAFGTGTAQSGWNAHSSDRTLEQLLGSNATSPFINTTEFKPVAGLGLVIETAPAGFPTTDFYGNTRTFPGAPGAVAW